jgi:hypothetical protein
MPEFDHLVTIDAAKKRLDIYRVHRDGRRDFFTSVDLPQPASAEEVTRLALQLGENLLIGSPTAREWLKL